MAHACGCHSTRSAPVLDVRAMAPRIRHPKIFEAFDALRPGEAFVLVNDHDPKPLFYQFQAERAGGFRWTYTDQGPEVWRVEIGKRAAAWRADQTVEEVGKDPAALAALKEMGVNHCCGAHLTLTEAAAAAGVTVEKLLDRLNHTADPPA